MNNKIRDAFLEIKAEDRLKQETASFLSQEIRKQDKKAKYTVRRSLSTVLAICLVFFSVGGYTAWAMPKSYISVDINPSVELTLNRFDRVIATTAYNEEGQFALDEISLKGKKYTNAIDILVASETMRPYLTEDASLSFTVVSDKKEELIVGINNCKGYKQYGGTFDSVDYNVMQEARENDLSLKKYKMYLLLSTYDETITIEACRNFTMRELRDILNHYGELEK